MLSEQFRERIGKAKYARWAKELTEEHLEALLSAVGEYGYRSHETLKVLRQHAPRDHPSYARAILALEILADFSHERPTNLEHLQERIRKALGDVRTAQESQLPAKTDAET